MCSGSIVIGTLSAFLFAVCYIGIWTIGRWVLPRSVEFRGLNTFRDLSQVIAASTRS